MADVVTSTVAGMESAPASPNVIQRAIDAAIRDTSDKIQALTGSTPNPAAIIIVSGLLRIAASGIGGGISVYSQTVSASDWQLAAGIILMGGAGILSVISKRLHKWQADQANKASAAASAHATAAVGAPVAIPLQPA